jgi:RNA polymerase sigma-70 factor (ECF subfamily)
MDRASGSPDAAEGAVEAATVLRVAAGDPIALGELYDRLAPRVYLLARSVCGEAGVAEDVTYEAFLELWRLADRIDPTIHAVAAWLLTAAHRRALEAVGSGAPASPAGLDI